MKEVPLVGEVRVRDRKKGRSWIGELGAEKDPHLGAEKVVPNQRYRGLPTPSTEAEHLKA